MVDKTWLHAQVLILCQLGRPIANLRLINGIHMKIYGMAIGRRKLVLMEQSAPYQVEDMKSCEIRAVPCAEKRLFADINSFDIINICNYEESLCLSVCLPIYGSIAFADLGRLSVP